MDEEISDLFKFAGFGHVENVIASIMQIIACPPDCAKCRVSGHNTGKSHRLLGFWCSHVPFLP
jgi:hypothetical protein